MGQRSGAPEFSKPGGLIFIRFENRLNVSDVTRNGHTNRFSIERARVLSAYEYIVKHLIFQLRKISTERGTIRFYYEYAIALSKVTPTPM